MPFITDLIGKITNFRVKVGDKLNTLKSQIGQLNSLTTDDKTSLVEAVNEVNRKAVVHDGNLTINATNGLTGSGSFTANQSSNSIFDVSVANTHKLPTVEEWNALPTTNTITRLRGTTSGTYTSGDLTLLAGSNVSIAQSGNNFTINAIDTNTTYTAGNGLTLSGTTFSLPITTSGTGNAVVSIAQTANGITQTMGSFLPLTGGTTTGGITSPSFIKTDGTSNQFLKADGSVDSNKYLTINDIKDSYPLVDGSAITDYNNVTSAGRYYITADVIQQQILNRPSQYSGVLEVTYGHDGWCFQRFTEYSGTQTVFHRRFYNGTWTEWVKNWNSLVFNPDDKANVNGENTVGGAWKIQSLFSPELYGDNKQVFFASGDTIYWGNPTLPHHRFEVKDATTGFNVYDITRGEKPIWSGHNFNPDTKANTTGNYQGLIVGKATASISWNNQIYENSENNTNPLYIMSFDQSNYRWKPTNKNIISNWLRPEVNKVNPAGLKEATYGDWYGIVQESSSDNPTNNWYNKLKILHNNSYGYSTELAQSFGSEGIFYRSTVQQTSNWTKLWDKNDFNDSRVSNWDTAYNSIGFPLSNLTTNNKTSLVGAVNEVNNIQIGGRNLLINSKESKNGIIVRIDCINLMTEDYYTFSFLNNAQNADNITVQLYDEAIGNTANGVPADIGKLLSVGQRYIYTINLLKNTKYTHFYISSNTGSSLNLKNFKLEKGNKATDWTPSPEDQVSNWAETDSNSLSFIKGKEIVNNEFNNVYDQISSRANNRLSNLASDLTADEKRVIQDKTGAVSKTGDNVIPNSVWSNFSAGVKGIAAGDDAYRIVPYVIGNDDLQLEIATSDGGNEPIVVRQYHGTATTVDSAFQTINREAYLLDTNGNTSFPGTVTAQRFRMTGMSTAPKGKVDSTSSIWQLGDGYGYGISMNQGGGLDIMANQSGQSIRLWSGQANSNPYKSMEINGSRVDVYGTVTAPAFYESSLRKYKKNIKEYSNSALDIVKSLDVVTYDRTDSDISNKIGIIADDSHEDVLNEEKTAVDLYKTIFVLTKAVQELSEKVEKLESKIV